MKIFARLLIVLIMTGAVALQTGCQPKPNPQVTIEMQDGKKIVVELLPEYAPNTVKNFVSLAQDGAFDGTIFHRILPGLIIQGGGIALDSTSAEGYVARDPGYTIEGEFIENGFKKNTLKHTRGVISMARTTEFDSASNQFFIMQGENPDWDGAYCAFGQVISGIENVDAIVDYVTENGIEENPPTIKTVTVDTFGVNHGKPKMIKE